MVQTTNNSTENAKYTLSIQVSLNGFSFCIVNSNIEIIKLERENFGIQLSPEQVLEKIKLAFDQNQNLKQNFSTIEVIYQNDLYSLVPKALFDPEALGEYLKYTTKVLSTDFIVYDELNPYELMNVYIPYTNINNFFFETFGAFTYKHTTSILLEHILYKEKNNDIPVVYAHMSLKYFDLIVIDKGKLILSNSYPHETKEDFLYYLLFVTEQLRLNPEEFKLFFLGDITKDSDYYAIAHTYIRTVAFGNRNNSITLSPEIQPIEPHQHFTLLSHF
ncbi:DUF3822 family protein [Aquimarina addita]|uniref:DUF3822 family protein n=1 Tax=Aquimarina addita TaxID=870485 RepID=A0ABP6UK61_9FLAO